MVINYLIFEVPSDVSILIILLKPESIRKTYKATNVIYKKKHKKNVLHDKNKIVVKNTEILVGLNYICICKYVLFYIIMDKIQ